MALKSCPSCRSQVSRSALACPKCGHNLAADRSLGWALVIVIIIGLGAVMAATSEAAYAQQVYRCTGLNGETVFSHQACADNTAGTAVKAQPANTLQSGRRGGGDPPADKYTRPLDLSGDIHSNFRRVKAIVDVGQIKSRDCDWDMKVTKKMERCKDFMAFIVEGSEYSQGLEYVISMPDDSQAQLKYQLSSMLRAVENITQTKTTLMAYIRSL